MDYIEEAVYFLDREVRFPIRIRLNRVQRKFVVLRQQFPLLNEYLFIIFLIIVVFAIGYALDYIFN